MVTIRRRGAIFCQVKRIKHCNQFSLLIISGNQKCRGGIPVFNTREKKIKLSSDSIVISLDNVKLAVALMINKIEPKAWIKKYLIEASVRGLFNLISIRGIILIILISSPNQAVNQELEETATAVPNKRVTKNKHWCDLIKIKKKGGCTLMSRV